MSFNIKILTFLILGIIFVFPVFADDAAMRGIFEERYDAIKKAMAARDEKAISAILTHDFISIDVSGNILDSKHMIQQILLLPADASKESKTTLLSIKNDGEIAIIDQHYDMRKKKTAPDGKIQMISLATDSTDIWKKSGRVWLMQKTLTNKMLGAVVD